MLLATSILRKHSEFVIHGIQRLLSFEVKGGGFSLFGHSPANPSLTAYGILEFHKIVEYLEKRNQEGELLKQVKDTLYRAETWLLSEDSIQSNWCQKTVMDWIGRSSCDTTKSYIYYALSHRQISENVGSQIIQLYNAIMKEPNAFSTYMIALEGLTLSHLEEDKKVANIHSILLKRQAKDGSFTQGIETITSGTKQNQ